VNISESFVKERAIIIKILVNRILFKFGFYIRSTRSNLTQTEIFGDTLPEHRIVDLDKFVFSTNFIPGMTDLNEGKILFVLAALQRVSGDIVEVGSWQGKSSSFLAKSLQISDNGNFLQ